MTNQCESCKWLSEEWGKTKAELAKFKGLFSDYELPCKSFEQAQKIWNTLVSGRHIAQLEQELAKCEKKLRIRREAHEGCEKYIEELEAERDRLLERVEGLQRQVIQHDAENGKLREALEKIKQKCLGHAKDPEMEIDKIYEIAENALAGGQGEGETPCTHRWASYPIKVWRCVRCGFLADVDSDELHSDTESHGGDDA
jgi:chromosome segregation ATPase